MANRAGITTTTAMQINSAPSFELIRDAWSMEDRPLILAGGPKAIYEPDHYFGLGPNGDIHADAVATGEELVLLELLDRVTAHRGQGETMLRAFHRCRDEGLLADIPGLVYMSKVSATRTDGPFCITRVFSGWCGIWTSCRIRGWD